MQLTAKLIDILPAQTFQGRNGEWTKQEIIVETEGQYAKKICVTLSDKIPIHQYDLNTMVTFEFELESREYNGRWYTTVRAWRMAPPVHKPATEASQVVPSEDGGEEDELPF